VWEEGWVHFMSSGGIVTITELAKYIRFQLGELRAQNKHHEFEHLARQFARLRICENILPATGPVGAGGDKGHDFETYRTYLASTPIATSTFFGSAKDKKLVFACSLQQDIAQKNKIRCLGNLCRRTSCARDLLFLRSRSSARKKANTPRVVQRNVSS
jgi:hypothetical protein